MKISEERYLKLTVRDIKRYAKVNTSVGTFYKNLDTLNCRSLQDLSFHSDLKFFAKCNFILNVIISIIAHPHLTNKGEDIIIRREQASSLTNEMFLKTIHDPRLWKNNNGNYEPESVYYYQNVDDIRIYENIFIVMLLNMLETEANKYNDFYASLIKTVNKNDSLSLEDDAIFSAFDKIDKLIKKIKRLKNTYFYKEISKGSTIISNVYPTNILLKDRLYNYCFKFYKTLIAYNDKKSLRIDFNTYYYVILLKTLKERGFRLSSTNKDDVIALNKFGAVNLNNNLSFLSKDFKINVYRDNETEGFKIDITNRNMKLKASHLLMFDNQSNFAVSQKNVKDIKNINSYTTIESLSLWSKAYLDDKLQIIDSNSSNEYMLMNDYFEDKTFTAKASYHIYSKYCPVCKKKEIEFENGLYRCLDCNSIYAFDETQETIWHLKLRRY